MNKLLYTKPKMKYLSLKDSVAVFFSQQFWSTIKEMNQVHAWRTEPYLKENIQIHRINYNLDTLYRYSQYDFIDKLTWVNSIFEHRTGMDRTIYYLSKNLNIPYKQQMLIPYKPRELENYEINKCPIPKEFKKVCATDWINHIKDYPLHEENVINKVRFEEFIIDEYQPSAIMVICLEDEDVCLTNYATNNGIPNLICQQKQFDKPIKPDFLS